MVIQDPNKRRFHNATICIHCIYLIAYNFRPKHAEIIGMTDRNDNFKLTYLPGQARIRLVLSKAACDQSPHPPEDVIKRAVARLDQGVKDGSLAFYNLYSARLELLWQRMRAAKFKPDKKIALTLAAGTPHLPEVKVFAGPAPFIASLTIEATTEKISTWKFEFVKLTVQKRLTELDIKSHLDSAMLQAIFVRALRGKKIDHMPLSAAPPHSTKQGEHFHVLPRGMTGDLVLVINNIASVATKQARSALLDWLGKYIEAAGQKSVGKNYLFLKEDVETRLKSFLRGPERLSIDLPAVILVALAEPKQISTKTFVPKSTDTVSRTVATTQKSLNRPLTAPKLQQAKSNSLGFNGNSYFEIIVEPNKMTANLKITSDRIYDDLANLTSENVQAFAKSKGILYGIKPTFFDDLKSAVTERNETKLFEMALGTSPVAPSSPYLRAAYRDAKEAIDGTSLRDRQQRNFVKKDELIAEISFKNAGITGCDVFGNVLPFVVPALPTITCGSHVAVQAGIRFVATKDGVPTVTENSVSIDPAFIHQGNVNLNTGNINFDGAVIITGNVEYGATVIANGDLEVKGVIEEAVIKCSGTLRATGIIAGPKGFIKVGGDAHVTFINNAQIEVKSDLIVTGSISNSKIMVGRTVSTTGDDSSIIGGSIYFGQQLNCKNLGKSTGQTTTIQGGFDPFLQRKIEIKSKRLQSFETIKDGIRKSSRHLGTIKAASTTKKHLARKDDLKAALEHINKIITKVEDQLALLKSQLTNFSDTKVAVKGLLSQNCKVTLNGKTVQIPNDVIEVAIFSKRVKGSFIVPLSEDPESSGQKSA